MLNKKDRAGQAGRKTKRPELPANRRKKKSKNLTKPTTHPRFPNFPIVGVGASAGGIEVFGEFLRALPEDVGMAFILIQHLAANYESMLTEILSRSSKMPIQEARDQMEIEPNHVYVMPPDVNMSLGDGELRLVKRVESRGHHLPIDYFLTSLAENCGGSSIGIILSGMASDGTAGLKAIKASGGVTFAQDPKTAKYDGMPRSAIAAGVVDFVLAPGKIAEELVKIRDHPYVCCPPEGMDHPEFLPDGRDLMGKIFFLLKSVTGVDFSGYKDSTIKRRINRRMVLHKIDTLKDYLKFLQENRSEISHLFEDVLINVTGFFRDPEVFESLKSLVFPQLIKERSPTNPIRIWIPGCSTGQEAYSVAMVLLEFLGDSAPNTPIQIFATDIDQNAIDVARAGAYPLSIASEISPNRLRRFFVKSNGLYRVSKTIRDLCIFAGQDVTRDPPFSRVDLICCRNLLIYLGAGLQKQIMGVFQYALKSPGFLLLGGSESIGEFSHLFGQVDLKHKIYIKKSTSTAAYSRLAAEAGIGKVEPAKKLLDPSKGVLDVKTEVDRLLLARFVPAGVVVNQSLDILQFRGQTGRFLEPTPGEASLNLLNMVREGLMLEVRAAVQTAITTRALVRKEGIRMRADGQALLVNFEVIPLNTITGNLLFLILFDEIPPVTQRNNKKADKNSAQARQLSDTSEVARLKQELTATREYLQSVIREYEAGNQELQSANEEIVSANEELQSTNEELETAKEELQSTNEELTTVNDELHNRNIELTRANNDQVNLLSSVNIPIIMLGSDLRIRRFTPTAERLLNLIPSDIGRPITDMKFKIEITNLEKKIIEVIESMNVHEEQVQDSENRWYSIRIRPYRTSENRIDGAVIALIDINDTKQGLQRLEEAQRHSRSILEFIVSPLLLLNSRFQVQKASLSYLEAFHTSAAQVVGRSIEELADGKWDSAQVLLFLEKTLNSTDGIGELNLVYEPAQERKLNLKLSALRQRFQIGGVDQNILILIFDRSALEKTGLRPQVEG